jgi:hypothetical protein
MTWHPDDEISNRTLFAWVVLVVLLGCLIIWIT